MSYARKLHRHWLKKLAYIWDCHLLRMANFKFVEEPKNMITNQAGMKPLNYKKEPSTMAKKPEMTKAEICIHKQARILEQETQILQLDKNEDPKAAITGGAKSRFEVMLDFM
jgi:hypothetical protein